MPQTKKTKINNSCINLFHFLKLLYENNAYYDEVVKIYQKDIDEKTDNTIQVILNKAINALKVFGIKIIKNKNKYYLDSSLYSLNYDIDDLKSISILLNAAKNFPDEKAKENILQLLQNIELRMDNNSRNKLSNIITNYDFTFFYKDLKDQITQCKELSKTEMSFDIRYIQNGEEIFTKGIAKDVIFDTKNAYLQMYDITNNLEAEIPLVNILMLDEHPAKSKSPEKPTTVTFEISGRLAKTYKLKDNESVLETKENGNLIITNKSEPLDKLFARLMKYSTYCNIIAPKSIKTKFLETINETLAQYEKDK